MKNEPKVIYLNCYDEAEMDPSYLPVDDDFNSLDGEYVLWSAETPCLGGHIKYVNANDLESLAKANPKMTALQLIDLFNGDQ